MDILMIGFAGLSGTKKIIDNRKELKKIYPEWFFRDFNDLFEKYSSKEMEDKVKFILNTFSINAIIDESYGGILSSLYHLSEKIKKGFTIDLLSIPIRQETIEISEHFGIDAYRLESDKTIILALNDASYLKDTLNKNGISSEIIGYTMPSKKKIILFDTDKEIRYLDKPREDELYKVIN